MAPSWCLHSSTCHFGRYKVGNPKFVEICLGVEFHRWGSATNRDSLSSYHGLCLKDMPWLWRCPFRELIISLNIPKQTCLQWSTLVYTMLHHFWQSATVLTVWSFFPCLGWRKVNDIKNCMFWHNIVSWTLILIDWIGLEVDSPKNNWFRSWWAGGEFLATRILTLYPLTITLQVQY